MLAVEYLSSRELNIFGTVYISLPCEVYSVWDCGLVHVRFWCYYCGLLCQWRVPIFPFEIWLHIFFDMLYYLV
jgi:hypothetical protein